MFTLILSLICLAGGVACLGMAYVKWQQSKSSTSSDA